MLRQGLRFFRSYHSVAYLQVLDTMEAYCNNPFFLEAQSKNYININHMQSLDKDSLKETIDFLFSKENASNTLIALDNGYFSISQLVNAKPEIRKAYLEALTQNQIRDFKGFERRMISKKDSICMDTIISRFTR